MPRIATRTATFPAASIKTHAASPVEVTLIAQLGHGAGDQLYETVCSRQRAHPAFVDSLDEPSARLGAMHPELDDYTSLYTFSVGSNGHAFHRHAGHRVFTAISGSGGARLRFSTASPHQLACDPAEFGRQLRHVEIPPDCLFTVRFDGSTWHQFLPGMKGGTHPALFAVSCHTNELGGDLRPVLRAKVMYGNASIPLLTEPLPAPVQAWLDQAEPLDGVPTTSLGIDAPPTSKHASACRVFRGGLGHLRALALRGRQLGGYLTSQRDRVVIRQSAHLPAHSLLCTQLKNEFHHEDLFCLDIADPGLSQRSASSMLADLLDGFLQAPPGSVSRLMALRNALVAPLGLRTSPLGCPVSSLLSSHAEHMFAGRFPVRATHLDSIDRHAQVILGADDRHLRFRSCVGIRVLGPGRVELSLGTRVQCLNTFGHLYMRLIDRVHRHHVSPAMLRRAAEHAFPAGQTEQDDPWIAATTIAARD